MTTNYSAASLVAKFVSSKTTDHPTNHTHTTWNPEAQQHLRWNIVHVHSNHVRLFLNIYLKNVDKTILNVFWKLN